MPVRTRRQAAASKSSCNEKAKEEANEPVGNHGWDILEGNLKSSIIKTYSKKQPFRTYWTSESKKSSKNTQDSHGVSSKPDSSVKNPRKNLSQGTLSSSPPSASIRKAPTTSSNNSTTTPAMPSSSVRNKSTVKRTRNKTRLAVESMTACTMLAAGKPSDINLTVEDMSLCSVVHAGTQDQDNKMIRNSTVLADCCNMNQDFVPNEISAIEGENDLQDTLVSNYNEQTPENQAIQKAAQSVKKVRFDVSQKTPKANPNDQPSAKRSIFRKTPYRNEKREDADRKCPKTSSPDPNKQISMLHCEISTLLIDDYPNKKGSENTSSNRMTQDTEKLLDFEPIPLQCSENVGENSRDITPESCNSVKGQTSSAKRRRRLSYHPDEEEIPACILLDRPVRKTKMKTLVWVGKNPHRFSMQDIESFPNDILL